MKKTIHHLTQMAAIDKLSPSFVPEHSVIWREYSLGVICLTVSSPNLLPTSSLLFY